MDCFDAGNVLSGERHVALFLEHPTLYGGEHSILAFCREISKRRYTFSVICPPGDRILNALAERKIRHLPFLFREQSGQRFPMQKLRNDLRSLLQEVNVDILHANSLSTSRIAGPVGASLRIPTVGHIRDIMRVSSQAMDDINSCSLVLCVSEATLEYHRKFGLKKDRSRVQYNGVDFHAFSAVPKKTYLRENFGINPETMVIGTAGQIILRKGLDTTVQAFAMLEDHIPGVHLLIAGERNSKKTETVLYDRKIRDFIESQGMGHRVHFVGYVDDMADFYRSIDIFAHSSRQEPLGRVLLEAAACGVPVIATRVGGTEEIFSKPDQAILIKPDEPILLANKIRKLINDGEFRLKLGRKGFDAIKFRFDIRELSQGLIAQYQSLLGERMRL